MQPLAGEVRAPHIRSARPPLRWWLAMRCAPDGEEAAGYRLLRARLRRLGDPGIVVVAGPGIGSAAVALNLALAFNEAHERVVLVDGRAVEPPLGALLGEIPRRLAIYEGTAPLEEAVVQLHQEYRRVILVLPAPPPERVPFDVLLAIADGPGRSFSDDRPGPRRERYFAGSATSSVSVVWPDTAR